MKNWVQKYLVSSIDRTVGRLPLTVSTQRDKKRVSLRNSPRLVAGAAFHVAAPIADREGIAVEDADGVAHAAPPFGALR